MEVLALLSVSVLGVGVASFAAFGVWSERRWRRAFTEALEEVGRRHRQSASLGVPFGVGDLVVVVDLVPTGGRPATRIRASHRTSPLPVSIAAVGSAAVPARWLQRPVRTGEATFDQRVAIWGEPDGDVVARLGPTDRTRIRWLVEQGATYQGAWTLDLGDVAADAELLDVLLRALDEASRALASDASAERLWSRIDDPDPGVRERAFELALSSGPPDAWLDTQARGTDPRRVLLASRARGEVGRARLWWLVDEVGQPWASEAALALAALPPDGRLADLEDALVRALSPTGLAAIEALQSIGTVRVVPALRALTGPLSLGLAATAALGAIRAIQDRASGEAGGLALAEPRGGELTSADDPTQGRLTVRW